MEKVINKHRKNAKISDAGTKILFHSSKKIMPTIFAVRPDRVFKDSEPFNMFAVILCDNFLLL